MLIIITLAADEFELLEEDELLEDELDEDSLDEIDELKDELLDSDEDTEDTTESDDEIDDEIEIDDETEFEDETEDELIDDDIELELECEDETVAVETDELVIGLVELDELFPVSVPAPQAARDANRQMIKGCFIGKCMVKFSLIIVMVDYTISSSGLYTSN